MPEYILVSKEEEYKAAATLFKEYAAWLNIDLSFQHFEEELAELKSMYALPLGGIILCKDHEEFIACIAIRPQETAIAELKRMYVIPAFWQKGIGNELLQRALTLAKACGYKKIRLDTLESMHPAMKLYQKNGFYMIPPYYFNPVETAVFFEKIL